MPSILNKISTFLKEVRLEMKKVNWPSRQETIQYTLIVIGVSVAVAIYLGGLDFLFSFLLNKFFIK
jgi:preprotein translocase subunit SecE